MFRNFAADSLFTNNIRLFFVILISAALLITISCGEKEDELLLQEARLLQEGTEYQKAIEVYSSLIDKFPESGFANEAEKGIGFCEEMITVIRKTMAMGAVEDLKLLARACEKYKVDKNLYPDSLNILVPEYIPSVPLDPWGNAYFYRVESTGTEKNARYYMASFGKDGLPGGEEDDIDQIVEDGEFIQKHKWLR